MISQRITANTFDSKVVLPSIPSYSCPKSRAVIGSKNWSNVTNPVCISPNRQSAAIKDAVSIKINEKKTTEMVGHADLYRLINKNIPIRHAAAETGIGSLLIDPCESKSIALSLKMPPSIWIKRGIRIPIPVAIDTKLAY